MTVYGFDRGSIERVGNATRWVERHVREADLTGAQARGLVQRPDRSLRVRVRNSTGGARTMGQLVELDTDHSTSPLIVDIAQPTANSLAPIGVLMADIDDGAVGYAYVAGVCLVRYSGTVAAGTVLGTVEASYNAQPRGNGQMTCIDTTVVDGTNYALVVMRAAVPRLAQASADYRRLAGE